VTQSEKILSGAAVLAALCVFASTIVGVHGNHESAPPSTTQPPADECICGEVRQCISDGEALYQQCVGDPRRRVSIWSRCLTAEGK